WADLHDITDGIQLFDSAVASGTTFAIYPTPFVSPSIESKELAMPSVHWFRAVCRLFKPTRPIRKQRTTLCQVETLEDRTTPSALLWTDHPDYPPGSTALLGGSGFGIGETIHLQVVRTDGIADI